MTPCFRMLTNSLENLAAEAHGVLIKRRKPSRTYPKARLLAALARSGVSTHFLKLCLEWDDTRDLSKFRKGLLLVVQARGASEVARKARVSRVTLYRMLGSAGNPRLSRLIPLLRELGVRLWVVDEEFIARRGQTTRPKDQLAADSEAREVGPGPG
jgi:DNA-binding phage protein